MRAIRDIYCRLTVHVLLSIYPYRKKTICHKRRMETEGKAKVVTSVSGTKFVQFLAALAVFFLVLFERNS